MNRIRAIVVACVGILAIGVLVLVMGAKKDEGAVLITNVSGENLASYAVTIDGVPVTGRGTGLVREFDVSVGTHDIRIEANGYSSYLNQVTIRAGKNELRTVLTTFFGPQQALQQALGADDEDSWSSVEGSSDTYKTPNGVYTIKNAAYFRENTWLVARMVTGSQNSDGEVLVMQLIDGRWRVVASGTGLSSADLPQGTPEEIATYLGYLGTVVSSESTANNNTTGNNTSGGSGTTNATADTTASGGTGTVNRTAASRDACLSGGNQISCEIYLRSIGAYFVSQGTTTTSNRCGAGGGTQSGGYLTITFPLGVDEAALATSIEAYIRKRSPSSPWLSIPNIGTRLITEGKKYNVNPVLIVSLGTVESNLGTSSVARRYNNYFGQKASAGEYRTFSSPEDSLFGPNSIIAGMPNRLATHPNYKNVKNLYEYYSVHVSGQIMYPGDNIRIYDEIMDVWVTSELDSQYGPIPYWRMAVGIINGITGQNYPSTPPTRGESPSTASSSCGQTAGVGGWDLPSEGPNPMTYYSQLYKCDENAPAGRGFAKACDKAVGDNAFGSNSYGSGTIEQCGCGPTSLAMIVTTITGKTTTPVDVARYAEANGGVQTSGCGSSWFWTGQATQDYYGIQVSAISVPEIAASLRAGRMVIVSLSNFPTTTNSVGHISVIRKIDAAGNFYFADPYAGAWSDEKKPETASRMPYTEAELAAMLKGSWSVQRK